MKRLNRKAYKHNYPKDYKFMRHKRWKGDCNDAARKHGKRQCKDGIEDEWLEDDEY